MAIIFLSYRDTDRLHVRRISCTEWRIRLKFFVEVRIWIQFYWRVGSGSSVFGGSDRYRIFLNRRIRNQPFLRIGPGARFLGNGSEAYSVFLHFFCSGLILRVGSGFSFFGELDSDQFFGSVVSKLLWRVGSWSMFLKSWSVLSEIWSLHFEKKIIIFILS